MKPPYDIILIKLSVVSTKPTNKILFEFYIRYRPKRKSALL